MKYILQIFHILKTNGIAGMTLVD